MAGIPEVANQSRLVVCTFKCLNMTCRIVSFVGLTIYPLSTCPLCQTPGTFIKEGI